MNALKGFETAQGIEPPYYEGSGQTLEDRLNINTLSRMIEDFCSVTGLMVDIIDKKSGEIIVAEGAKSICSSFHRDCPTSELSCKSLTDVKAEDRSNDLALSHCDLGLSMACAPVIIGGDVVAEIFVGPVLLAPMSGEQVKNISKSTGIDAGFYHGMMNEVSVVGPEELRKAMSGLTEAVRIMATASAGESEKSEMAAYMALFMAKRGFLKDS